MSRRGLALVLILFCLPLFVDLRSLDWDRNSLWKYVLACYPYGLTYDSHPNPAYRNPYVEIVALAGNKLPYVIQGAVLVALFAILTDLLFARLARALAPPG